MEKESLIKSAEKITKVSEASLKEYVEKIDLLSWKMNKVMLERKDILELIGGTENIEMMKNNHNNHLQFIASILETPDAESLVDTVLWVFRAYMSRGFSSTYWAAQLDTWKQILKENVSEKSTSELFVIYNWLIVNIPNFTIAADDNLEKSKHMDHD